MLNFLAEITHYTYIHTYIHIFINEHFIYCIDELEIMMLYDVVEQWTHMDG